MEENNNDFEQVEEKDEINKAKIIANSISIALGIVISVVILFCIYIILKPNLENSNVFNTKVFTSEQLERLEKAAQIIASDYLYEYDTEKLIDGAIDGMVSSLENVYTYYQNEEEYQESLNSGSNENYVGIGVHLTFDSKTKGIKILGTMADSPAEKCGIKPGDVIMIVDDLYVNLDTYREALDAIKGEENTTVKLTILRGEEIIELDVPRVNITENNVSTDIIDNIGYIKVYSFDNGIYNQFKQEYYKLREKNVKGIIIDLRNNPGGLVSDTLQMLDLLLPECNVLKLVDKNGKQQVFKTDNTEQIDIPLAILVNQNSASASEIFTSAIKDSKKGVAIGTKTFGKGVVQYVVQIKGHGAISIVAAQYFTPSGVVIQDNGIEPDILVELPDEIKNNSYIDRDEDLQLQRAIQYINEQL